MHVLRTFNYSQSNFVKPKYLKIPFPFVVDCMWIVATFRRNNTHFSVLHKFRSSDMFKFMQKFHHIACSRKISSMPFIPEYSLFHFNPPFHLLRSSFSFTLKSDVKVGQTINEWNAAVDVFSYFLLHNSQVYSHYKTNFIIRAAFII